MTRSAAASPTCADQREHGMDVLHEMHRAQQIGLARAGCVAVLTHPADRARFAGHHRMTVQPVRPMGSVAWLTRIPGICGEGVIGRSSTPYQQRQEAIEGGTSSIS